MSRVPLRVIARASGVLAVVTATAAAMLTFVVPPAGALAQQRITLREGEIKEVTYPGIPGNNPANDLHDPATCNVSAYCDTIPITFVRPPDFDDTQDYFVQFKMSWESEKVPDALEPSGERAVNDMDMFIYNDPVQEDAGPDQDGVIAMGATGGEPEIAYLFAPEGNYSLVVVNFVGVNTAYTIKLTWVSESITTPFESLAPTVSPNRPGGVSEPAAQPTPAPPLGADFEAPSLPAPVLEQSPLEPDAAFDEGFGPSALEDTLAAPPSIDFEPARVVDPDPPPGFVLVLWLLVLPLAGVAFGGTYLSRRSAALLRV